MCDPSIGTKSEAQQKYKDNIYNICLLIEIIDRIKLPKNPPNHSVLNFPTFLFVLSIQTAR